MSVKVYYKPKKIKFYMSIQLQSEDTFFSCQIITCNKKQDSKCQFFSRNTN